MSENDATQDMPPDMPLPEPKPVEKPRGRVGMIFGGYEVVGELGRGGMGVVYRARQAKLNREVALKMLTGHYGKDELQRFLGEAQTAAGLHHTNIVQIYEVGEIDGAPFFSMEFIEGGTLAERLRKGLPPPRETAQLLATVARALHFAHQRGVVHRDMKPHNILIDPDGVPKVADFGIAKRLNDDSALTRSGAVMGTPTYMAPEQAKGTSRDVGPAADVYSLGAILYEMLTGRPPFLPEESETAITIRVLTEDTVSPAWHRPETPRELEVICLKCLQKDPRDRYTSAAALAEDLRRYLDDEPILARPPSRLVKTIKWVRRHPWKFTSRIGLLALLLGSAQALWQWEFYRRPHFEYAIFLDYQFGTPIGSGVLMRDDVGRRNVSLRFTRQGRWGAITRVEALNSRGRPASVGQFLGTDVLPNWIEGALGVQDGPKKTRETTSIDYAYENGTVTEAVARNCNGLVNWRLIYDRPGASNAPRTHARYVTPRGFDFASRGGASLIEFERDATGHEIKVTFFSGSGVPATNGEGVYGYQIQRNARGQIVGYVNLDRNGQHGPNRIGEVGRVFQLGAGDLVERTEFRDAEGQSASLQGISAYASSYDGARNLVRTTRLDSRDRPSSGQTGDWAQLDTIRNERGEIMELRFSGADAEGHLFPLSKKSFAYDQNGYPADIHFEGRLNWRTGLHCDERGNVLEEKILGAKGEAIPGPQGWAIHRHAYQFSPDGVREEETWFDAHDAPAYSPGGEHRRISEIDAAGNLRRVTTDGHDPARFAYQRWVTEPEYDAQGRQRRSTTRFENAQGQLATEAGLPYTVLEVTMDESEREATRWELGCPVGTFGAPVWRTEMEWYSSGMLKKRTRQAFDAARQPLSTITNGNPALRVEEFSEVGKPTRIWESGFDENRVGFGSRETTFSAGEFEGVTHKRNDGTPMESVRVIIVGIFPDAQAKSRELLKEGDQFLSANGEPVKSAYEWVFMNRFAGGWIEVLRDGQRLRLEGFEAGKLGIAIEDRGPGVP